MRRPVVTRTALVALLCSGQVSQVLAEASYFRWVVGRGTAQSTTPPPLDPNAVRGDGDLAIYAPLQVRARPGIPFKLAFFVENAKGAVAWTDVGAGLPPGLSLGPSSGAIEGVPTGVGTFAGVKVRGTDGEPKTGSTKAFTIDSIPLPVVRVDASSYETRVGKKFGIEPGVDNVFGSQTWRVRGTLPGGLSLDGGTGAVSGAAGGRGVHKGLRLAVVDGDGAPGESDPFDLVVIQELEMRGLRSAYYARLGQTFPAVSPIVTGAKGALAWSTDPALPAGLSIDPATGRISGTGTATDRVEGLVVKAEDGVTGEVAASTPLTFAVAGDPTVLLDKDPYEFRVGTTVEVRPAPVGLLRGGYWSIVGGVPLGFKLDTETGALTGKPSGSVTAPGLRFHVVDIFDGRKGESRDFTVQVNPKLEMGAPLPPQARVASPFTMQPPTLLGLVGSASWSVDGSLPDGLSVDAATGEIKGTPTVAGTAGNLTYVVTDSRDNASAKSTRFAISTVEKGVVLPFSANPLAASYAAPAGSLFRLRPGTTGAKASVSWIPKGPLPRWVTMNMGTGELSGVPDEMLSYEGIVLVARDGSAGPEAETTPFTIKVVPLADAALSLAYEPSLAVDADAEMEEVVPAIVGASPDARYGLTSGPLPPGLSVDPKTGAIKGTPSVAGLYPGLVVTLFDGEAGERTALSNSFSMTVAAARKATMARISTPIGFPASFSPTTENMRLPISWSVSGGALPGWARLDPVSGVISGTPDVAGSPRASCCWRRTPRRSRRSRIPSTSRFRRTAPSGSGRRTPPARGAWPWTSLPRPPRGRSRA
jgi:hypothetical protein